MLIEQDHGPCSLTVWYRTMNVDKGRVLNTHKDGRRTVGLDHIIDLK